MLLVVSNDSSHVSQEMVEDSAAVLGAQLCDGARQHVLSFTRAQHVH